MSNVVVVGSQWGDEGKGKVIDLLARYMDVVVRFHGGHNAGHTILVDGEKYVFHVLPSGLLYPEKLGVIGSGMVVYPQAVFDDMKELSRLGKNLEYNFRISNEAHVIMPYHLALDAAREESKGNKKIGTTGRGIGPCYEDKASRIGIRVGDLLDSAVFREKLTAALDEKNFLLKHKYNKEGFDAGKIYDDYSSYAHRLAYYVCDTSVFLNNLQAKGKRILFEGGQGDLLDIDHGTYPFVTSSSTGSANAALGSGVAPKHLNYILGVAKAYTTRVGEGPFPTELTDDLGKKIREKGGEYGASTGRARRCGWFDALVVNHSKRMSGLDALAITKLDVLDILDYVRSSAYYSDLDDKPIYEFPSRINELAKCKPTYENFHAWKGSAGVRDYQDLPSNAKVFLDYIEDSIGVPICLVGTGADRKDIILKEGTFLDQIVGRK